MIVSICRQEDRFSVVQGDVEIAGYTDLREAKACRGAVAKALESGNPVLAIVFGLQAAMDPAIVASYNDQPDENCTFRSELKQS